MPYINVAGPNTKAEAVEAIAVTAGPSPGSLAGVQTVDPVTHLRSAKIWQRMFSLPQKGTF